MLRNLLISFALAVGMAVPGGAQSQALVTPEGKQAVLDAVSDILHSYAFVPNVDFNAWNAYIAKESDAIKKATTNAQFGAAVQDALTKFGLSHIYLLTPEAVSAQEHNEAVGIGITVAADPDGLLITRVYDKTPAAKAGLAAGDIILEAEGKKPTMIGAVRGPEGSTVNLKIRHPNGKVDNLKVLRVSYSIYDPPSSKRLDPHSVYVKIPTFHHVGYDPAAVEDLFAKLGNADNLVLDLRNNPGGEIVNLMHLMSLLLPPKTEIGAFIGPIDLTRYKGEHTGPVDLAKVADEVPEERRLRVAAGRLPFFKGHIAVLINKSSGSASEMAAAALRDHVNATLVGSRTAAAVLVSVIRELPEGFKLQYPIRDYITSGHERLEGKGVEPDIAAKDPRVPGVDADEPLNRAVAVIERLSKETSLLYGNFAGFAATSNFGAGPVSRV
jgi:carboxyl-terminal processing protease